MSIKAKSRSSLISRWRMEISTVPMAFCLAVALTGPSFATSYFFDNVNGSNANDGLGPQSTKAWKNPDALHKVELAPGDRLRFLRGSKWSGFTLRIETPDIKIDSIGNMAIPNAIFSGAAPLDHERLTNADLDVYEPQPAASSDTFYGWLPQPKGGATVRADTQTPSGSGRSAKFSASQAGQSAKLLRVTDQKLAAGLPVRYRFRVKIAGGQLAVQIKNRSSGRYLSASNKWVSGTSTARTITSTNNAWTWVTIDLDNDTIAAKQEMTFVATGGVSWLDDFELSTPWEQHQGNIYRRAAVTGSALNVSDVYLNEERLDRKDGLGELASHGDWHWDRDSRTLYIYFNGGLQSLNAAALLADRNGIPVITLAGQNGYINRLTVEKATEGVRISGNGSRIMRSVVRKMTAYSIRSARYTPASDVEGITIGSNEIYDSGNGPYLIATNNSVVSGNDIHDIRSQGDDKVDEESIPLQGGHSNVFEHNEIYDSVHGIVVHGVRAPEGSTVTMEAFDNIVRYNSIHDLEHVAIIVGGVQESVYISGPNYLESCDIAAGDSKCALRAWVYGNAVHHNVVYRNGLPEVPEGAFAWDRPGGIRVNKVSVFEPNYVFNNIMVGNQVNFLGQPTAGNYVFVNNISVDPVERHVDNRSSRTINLGSTTFKHNIYYPGSGTKTNLFQWRGKEYSSFNSYRSGTKNDVVGSLVALPEFMSPNDDDYSILPGDPAVSGKGAALSTFLPPSVRNKVGEDIDGNPLPSGAASDIGAYKVW